MFSPSVFSPSVFSPSVFSPSVFCPSVFSPSVFSPSVFSPSVFSPSVFSPSVFSDGQAYESVQVRSLIAVSANEGTAEEHLNVATWNNTGEFYVRVAGRNGAYSPLAPFDLSVSVDDSSCSGVEPSDADLMGGLPSPKVNSQALILVDAGRMNASFGGMPTNLTQLETATGGQVVDVGASDRVAALNQQADEYVDCPYAKNLVAEAIRDIVLAYRGSTRTRSRPSRSSAMTRSSRSSATRMRPASDRNPGTSRPSPTARRPRPACGSTTSCRRMPTGRPPKCS